MNRESCHKPLSDSEQASGGIGLLARRISSITSKCLLSAIVLVAGLGFGRQVMRWWAGDGKGTASPPLDDELGDSRHPHVLRFGEKGGTLRRETFVGDGKQALAALTDLCCLAVREAAVPAAPPSAAENDLLAQFAEQQPVRQEPGEWAVYATGEGVLMVAGVRWEENTLPPPDGNLADGPGRVVTWGLALPAGTGSWTLFTLRPAWPGGSASVSEQTGTPAELLPPSCHGGLSVAVVGGDELLAFSSTEVPSTLADDFSRWFRERGWSICRPWEQSDAVWHARFTRSAKQDARHAEVRFSQTADNGVRGTITISPKNRKGLIPAAQPKVQSQRPK